MSDSVLGVDVSTSTVSLKDLLDDQTLPHVLVRPTCHLGTSITVFKFELTVPVIKNYHLLDRPGLFACAFCVINNWHSR